MIQNYLAYAVIAFLLNGILLGWGHAIRIGFLVMVIVGASLMVGFLLKTFVPAQYKGSLLFGLALGIPLGIFLLWFGKAQEGLYALVGSLILIQLVELTYRDAAPEKPLRSFEDKVKHDLGLSWTINKQYSFPKIFDRIGGFVTPALPFFTIKNKNWKPDLNTEATIHELQHIRLLLKGWILLILIGAILASIVSKLVPFPPLSAVVFCTLTAIVLTTFEYHTFAATKSYAAEKHKITTRSFSLALAMKYMKIYTFFLLAVYGVEKLISFLITILK